MKNLKLLVSVSVEAFVVVLLLGEMKSKGTMDELIFLSSFFLVIPMYLNVIFDQVGKVNLNEKMYFKLYTSASYIIMLILVLYLQPIGKLHVFIALQIFVSFGLDLYWNIMLDPRPRTTTIISEDTSFCSNFL